MQGFRSIVLAASACLSATALQAQPAPNWIAVPLTNASFEEGTSTPKGWLAVKGNTRRSNYPSVVAWDKEFAHTGQRSFYIRKEEGGPTILRSLTSVSAESGAIYRLQVWLRTTGSGKYASATIGASSSDRGPGGERWSVSKRFEAGASVNPDWQLLSLELSPPEWVKTFSVSATNASGAHAGSAIEFWFDDFSLEKSADKPAQQ